MATTISNLNNGVYPIATLDTYNYTVLAAGRYQLSVKLVCSNPMTGISVTIKQNGTTLATVSEPPAHGNELNCRCLASIAINDNLSFVIASANAADSIPNTLHGKIHIILTNVPCGI